MVIANKKTDKLKDVSLSLYSNNFKLIELLCFNSLTGIFISVQTGACLNKKLASKK